MTSKELIEEFRKSEFANFLKFLEAREKGEQVEEL